MSLSEADFFRRMAAVMGPKKDDIARRKNQSLRELGQTLVSQPRHKHTRGTQHATKRIHVTSKAQRKAQRVARRRNRP